MAKRDVAGFGGIIQFSYTLLPGQAAQLPVVTRSDGAAIPIPNSDGGLDLPESLASAAGSRPVKTSLEADHEFASWMVPESELASDGLIGLRVRTQAHGIAAGIPGSIETVGTGTNWVQQAAANGVAGAHRSA